MAFHTITLGLTQAQLQGRIAELLLEGKALGNNEFPLADMRGLLENGLHVLASTQEITQALEDMQEAGMVVFKEGRVRFPK